MRHLGAGAQRTKARSDGLSSKAGPVVPPRGRDASQQKGCNFTVLEIYDVDEQVACAHTPAHAPRPRTLRPSRLRLQAARLERRACKKARKVAEAAAAALEAEAAAEVETARLAAEATAETARRAAEAAAEVETARLVAEAAAMVAAAAEMARLAAEAEAAAEAEVSRLAVEAETARLAAEAEAAMETARLAAEAAAEAELARLAAEAAAAAAQAAAAAEKAMEARAEAEAEALALAEAEANATVRLRLRLRLRGGMEPGCGSGAAGSSEAAPAVDSLGIAARLMALSPDELNSLEQAITQPASETQRLLAEMWRDPLALEAAWEAINAARQMPADAAERWGTGVAAHHCTKRDGNCFALLAREQPQTLDKLRERLCAAQQASTISSAVDAVVPARKLLRLRHEPGASSASAVPQQVKDSPHLFAAMRARRGPGRRRTPHKEMPGRAKWPTSSNPRASQPPPTPFGTSRFKSARRRPPRSRRRRTRTSLRRRRRPRCALPLTCSAAVLRRKAPFSTGLPAGA